jgi:hypothetical protein
MFQVLLDLSLKGVSMLASFTPLHALRPFIIQVKLLDVVARQSFSFQLKFKLLFMLLLIEFCFCLAAVIISGLG